MSDRAQTEVVPYGKSFERLRLGLRIVGKPSFEEWYEAGQQLWRDRTSLQWCVGDWLYYGEIRGDFGETYTQAVEVTQYSEQTLMNLVWVSSHIEISRRREKLSWSHHEAVASLDPALQDKLLMLAEKHKWDRNTIREEAQKLKPPKSKGGSSGTSGSSTPSLTSGDEQDTPIANARVPAQKLFGIEELAEQLENIDEGEYVRVVILRDDMPPLKPETSYEPVDDIPY